MEYVKIYENQSVVNGFCMKILTSNRNTKRCVTKNQIAYDMKKEVCARFVERNNNLNMRLHGQPQFNPFYK